MTSTLSNPTLAQGSTDRAENVLDVDWLLHKRDTTNTPKRLLNPTNSEVTQSASQDTLSRPSHTPRPRVQSEDIDPLAIQPDASRASALAVSQAPGSDTSNPAPKSGAPTITAPSPVHQSTSRQALDSKSQPVDQILTHRPSPQPDKGKGPGNLKKDGRRQSWFSSLGSKLSGGDKTTRTSSVDSAASTQKSPRASPAWEKKNPFDSAGKTLTTSEKAKKEEKTDEEIVLTSKYNRRPSVLVAAGTETKLDKEPGFLSSALRRLSSGNTATLGKAAGTNHGIIMRKVVMNVDHHRLRTNVAGLEPNKLRRVAFKVDVEIAGVSAMADEEPGNESASTNQSSESKSAKLKDMSEGAALRKTNARDEEDETSPATNSQEQAKEDARQAEVKRKVEAETQDKAKADQQEQQSSSDVAQPDQVQMGTRKKEKKKRSEAERKERKERKLRHAQNNGLVPLELTVDDSSDSSPVYTPEGASTPRKGQPTVDPLRIYKRCCQLRETSVLNIIKDQINKPSAVLAEAPGTVASVDLSNTEMTLADIVTLGDWLAVVPVRRLILDNCGLGDEAIRVILSGLSGCKSIEQTRYNKRINRRASVQRIARDMDKEQMGVIERLSLKNNLNISSIGWKHIALFMNTCKSLRAIDLSGIAFPASENVLSRSNTDISGSQDSSKQQKFELGILFAKALSNRFGDRLEELLMSGCGLSTQSASDVIDSAIKCKIKRLGLANNSFSTEAVNHVVRYVVSGLCEGVDLAGNDLNGCGHILAVLDESNPLWAINMANCNLSVNDLESLLIHLSRLGNFRFLDLSRNYALFNDDKDCMSVLRKYLPRLPILKRIHFADINMSPSQIIALSEILPECPQLAHINVLDNQRIVSCMNDLQIAAQEEACAVFASLMTAARASRTLVAVEIEVPSQESSEVVKALAQQVVAYSLRNLERTSLTDFGIEDANTAGKLDRQAPEVLLHLVGHMEGYTEDRDNDEPAPDDDYVIASTGIVKALGVCLGNKDLHRLTPRNASPAVSGTATPTIRAQAIPGAKKPRDVSSELCESARKIRRRLQPAMVKEDQAGNTDAYRRLMYLDQTLERTIARFEAEYAESRPVTQPSSFNAAPPSSLSQSYTSDSLSRITSINSEEQFPGGLTTNTKLRPAMSSVYGPSNDDDGGLIRTGSNISLSARAQSQEEGRMHRFGQQFRREVLKPSGTDDALHGTSVHDPPEAKHVQALRTKLELLTGEQIRHEVELKGRDQVLKEFGIDMQQLQALEQDDPEAFARLKESPGNAAGVGDSGVGIYQ